MRKFVILSAIAISGLIYNTANAQIGIHVGFHFGQAPVVVERVPVYQEPVRVYEDNDYYYLPEVDAYYSVNQRCYYYNDGDNWVSGAYLPGAYRNYSWRNADRYEVRAARPYLHDDVYRSRYNGRPVTEWTRNYNRYDNGYVNRFRNEGSVRYYNSRPEGYNQHFDRGREGYNEHFDNRSREGYNQRFERRSVSQPIQSYREGERDGRRR